MEKYYNTFDKVFISDEFEGEFTDIKGEKYHGIIVGASIWIATILINKETGLPVYSVCDSKSDNDIPCDCSNNLFGATVNAELGVAIMPKTDEIRKIEEKTGLCVAGKILEYTIDVRGKDELSIYFPQFVTEAEFVRVIKENFEHFNNADNYHAQSCSYSYHKVCKYFPRE